MVLHLFRFRVAVVEEAMGEVLGEEFQALVNVGH